MDKLKFLHLMFTPKLVQSYKSSKSILPIGTWVQIIGKNLPQFKNNEDIYNPIPLSIKIAGGINTSNGSVSVSVAPYDPNWYENLVAAVGKMTGKSDISIVSYVGKPIQGMNIQNVSQVGECDVIDNKTGEIVRLKKIVSPPLELSTNKVAQLKGWWDSNKDDLSKKIASELKGLTMAEIAQATSVDGKVFDVINEHLKSNTLHDMEWHDFTKTFGRPIDSEEIAGAILDSVKSSLIANEKQIRDFHATEGIGSEATLWKKTAVGKNKYKDDFTMFRDVVDDAIYHTRVGQKIVQAISIGKRMGGGKVRGRRPLTFPQKKKVNNYHPVASYYKEHHYNVHGKLPGHVIESYNKSFGKIETEYHGDSDRAVDMFNLFSGRAVNRKPLVASKLPELTELPELVPIGEELILPELVPIGGEQFPELVPILPELVKINYIDAEEYEPCLTDFL